jgi:putative DNA primase/helicase
MTAVLRPWNKKTSAAPAQSPANSTAIAAQQYAAQGVPVFPCHPNKKPFTANGFYDATIDPEIIDYWWQKWPNALIGMPTGSLTGIAVLDLDVKSGKDGLTAVPDWQTRSSVIARTQSGGVHLYFKAAGAPQNTSDEIAVGVDTRGQGGYVILPPSAGYHWVNGHNFGSLPPWPDDLRPAARNTDAVAGDNPEADPELVAAAMEVLPNADFGWDKWNRIGMACWAASGGDNFEAFDRWSQKSIKYNAGTTQNRWRGYFRSPPTIIGAGTIFYLAEKASPGWRKTYEEATIDDARRTAVAMVETWCAGLSRGKPRDDKTDDQPLGDGGKRSVVICVADIQMRSKDWIWEGHLLRGAQELLTGLPGLGKSQVQIHYVACATAGLQWPDGAPACSPMNVIMLTAEDSLDQEVKPRLVAAGANVSRVHVLKLIRSEGKDRQFLLGEDLDQLERDVAEIGGVGLITIDPITAYMGSKIDSHKATEVRSQLGPLKDFAERMNLAVSTITHPPKSASQKAIDHFIGSQAFIAAGRIGHVCIAEYEDSDDGEWIKTGRILFTHAKHNASAEMPTYAFWKEEIVVDRDLQNGKNIVASRVVWDKEPIKMTADEAVAGASGAARTAERNSAQAQLQNFLCERLKKGSVPQIEIEREAASLGFSDGQLKLAKKKLGIVSDKAGFEGGWVWQLII